MKKMYISGKIRGLPLDKAKENFSKGCDIAKALGYEPVNPFDSGFTDEAPYDEHIRANLEIMYGCDAIGVLPDWHDSKGATNELREAIVRGMPVRHLRWNSAHGIFINH